jgi:hypothetical protein
MDTETQDIIISYINSSYEMSYHNMVRYQVEDLTSGTIVSLLTVWSDIQRTFGLSNLHAGEMFKLWVDMIAASFEEIISAVSEEDKSLYDGMVTMVKLRTQHNTSI